MIDGRVSKIPLRMDVSRLTASTDRDLIPIPPERRTYVNYIFSDLPGTAANVVFFATRKSGLTSSIGVSQDPTSRLILRALPFLPMD